MTAQMNSISMIARAFQEGGIWMYAILIVQIVISAIIVERIYSLFFVKTKNQKDLLLSFEEDIKHGRLEKVISRARNLSEQESIAAVIQAGAQAASSFGGKDEIQSKMDEVLSVENVKLERRTGFLSMFANVSTLLGLLGTIIGLIQAFASIANMNGAEKSLLLTQGVALAMNTTAYGLIVAIPTLIIYAILVNRTNQLQEELNQSAFKAFNWLSFNYESTARKINSSKSV